MNATSWCRRRARRPTVTPAVVASPRVSSESQHQATEEAAEGGASADSGAACRRFRRAHGWRTSQRPCTLTATDADRAPRARGQRQAVREADVPGSFVPLRVPFPSAPSTKVRGRAWHPAGLGAVAELQRCRRWTEACDGVTDSTPPRSQGVQSRQPSRRLEVVGHTVLSAPASSDDAVGTVFYPNIQRGQDGNMRS